MDPHLADETERLTRSWMQYDEQMLRDYLVADVQDPRLNIQSILGRHFLIEMLFGDCFAWLEYAELQFAVVMHWLMDLVKPGIDSEQIEAVHHALRRRADDAEGLPIPAFVLQAFVSLPTTGGQPAIPNYISAFLEAVSRDTGLPFRTRESASVFAKLWREVLGNARASACAYGNYESTHDALPHSSGTLSPTGGEGRGEGESLMAGPAQPSVLEAACGSANDYRFFDLFGLTRLIQYTGFDLCQKNIANARAQFPEACFEVRNVFETGYPDKSFDYCVAHDLLEHLSPAGLEVAVAELCRVTRRALSIGFFQMHEGGEHILRPVDEYHINTLSLPRVRRLFERHGAAVQAVHINSYLAQRFGAGPFYNDSAYTLTVQF